jgi:hypothetical protein
MSFAKYDGLSTPSIGGIGYAFPAASRTIGELAGDSQLASSVETLESFGFGQVHVGVEETVRPCPDRREERPRGK